MTKVGKLWLIGGTGDSVTIGQSIKDNSFHCLITVTTPTAAKLYPSDSLVDLQIGKLDTANIRQLCHRETIKGIIDASHPFAVNISQTVMQVAENEGIPYLRYERPSLTDNSYPLYLNSFEDLIRGDYLRNKRVLLTIGCKNLDQFQSWHQQATLYARILPQLDSLQMALKAGFSSSQIIALRPPITLELEQALWQQWAIDLLVTKASGTQGGEDIKVQVAKKLAVPLIVIKRPLLNYPQQTEQLSDIIKFCYKCFQK
ncbi:cobalt-precorrin-6A reductase [Crocosphaera sp. Alani8]|uniref:cobalt-precorrin-6A reductase n=1 Tax=Crocosphaera sp. Alani8 TaxID=3038952 RepID=UPI00313BDA25